MPSGAIAGQRALTVILLVRDIGAGASSVSQQDLLTNRNALQMALARSKIWRILKV